MLNKPRWLFVFLLGLCLTINTGCEQKHEQSAQTKSAQKQSLKRDSKTGKIIIEDEPFKYLNLSCDQVMARLTQKGLGKDKGKFHVGDEYVRSPSGKPIMQCVLIYNEETLQLHGLTGVGLDGDYKSVANLTKIDVTFNAKDRNHPSVHVITKELFNLLGISDAETEEAFQLMWEPDNKNGRRVFAHAMEAKGYEISYVPLGITGGFIITKR